jgi:hypothetical protein
MNEGRTRTFYISHQSSPPESFLTLNRRNIPFVNGVKYLGVIFDKKITWGLYIEMVATKAYRTFIRLYSLFKSDRLNTNIKLTSMKLSLSL